MSEPVVTPPAPNEPPAAATTPPVPTPPATPAAPAPTGNVWDDPDAAKAEIEKLRRENGADRVNAKAQAAADAKKEYAQTIAKALGLVDDDANDPAKLTASLTQSQSEAKQARVELAVFRNATTAGADPAALLDSSSFLKSLDGIDPNDAGAVSAAIAAAVAANPRLGAAPAGPATPQAPAPNPAQGASANGTTAVAQVTRAELDRMEPEAIEQARLDGRLNALLGIK
jgi:hypothetical protein